MNYEATIKQWIAAGFVRNLVWDKLHGFSSMTALDDIDKMAGNLAAVIKKRVPR